MQQRTEKDLKEMSGEAFKALVDQIPNLVHCNNFISKFKSNPTDRVILNNFLFFKAPDDSLRRQLRRFQNKLIVFKKLNEGKLVTELDIYELTLIYQNSEIKKTFGQLITDSANIQITELSIAELTFLNQSPEVKEAFGQLIADKISIKSKSSAALYSSSQAQTASAENKKEEQSSPRRMMSS